MFFFFLSHSHLAPQVVGHSSAPKKQKKQQLQRTDFFACQTISQIASRNDFCVVLPIDEEESGALLRRPMLAFYASALYNYSPSASTCEVLTIFLFQVVLINCNFVITGHSFYHRASAKALCAAFRVSALCHLSFLHE